MAQLKSTIVQGALTVTGNVVANKLIKVGGTSDQILMADGSTSNKSDLTALINAAVTIKGTLGTGGTITSLPTASASNLGYGYKVITAGTYSGVAAKIGDMFICYKSGSSYAWMHIPSGDDIEDTWRPVQVNGTQILANGNTTGAINLKAGSNVSITNSSGTVTFAATDTGATSIETTGSGNAVTGGSYDAATRKITLTKGATFLTAHQSLADYVKGPSSSTDNAVARFNSTTGKLIQNSTVTIDDNGNTVLPANATLKLNTYGTRFITLSGNNISADMSNETGGWAGAFASVKDPSGTTTTMLGWYGSTSLNHIYMGGAYNDPYMKMTATGLFTFKNQVTINAAQGTAPLAVTSTTVNTNLNADLLDGKHATEFALASDIPNDYLPKTTYEWNKEFAAGSNGAVSLGRYNLYDTQLTFDITTTTTLTISGKLVIAAQNGRIQKVTIYGDASNTLASYLTIYQSAITNSRSWVEVFCKFPGWSKNKVHIYGVALNSATVTNQMVSVTFTGDVPSGVTSGDTKWTGTIVNDITSNCAAINHTHDVNIAVSTGTNELTLAHGTKYALTAGGQSFIFTTPADNNTTYGADRGISLVSGKFGHSNTAITAQSTKGLYKISYDAYGHITGTESFTIPNPANYYWANVKVSATSSTATTPSVQKIGITGSTTATAAAAVTMEYDSSYKALKFVFA